MSWQDPPDSDSDCFVYQEGEAWEFHYSALCVIFPTPVASALAQGISDALPLVPREREARVQERGLVPKRQPRSRSRPGQAEHRASFWFCPGTKILPGSQFYDEPGET